MGSDYIGIFDVIGPMMVGPSSSHTSGADLIAWIARQIFTGTPRKVTFVLYGSFADTYRGHGTDRALIGGILGYKSNDVRIRDAYEHAKEAGLAVDFVIDKETEVDHPNTVDITMESASGHKLLVRGVSIGGGRVRITRLNEIPVDFTGEYSTLLVGHQDEKGTLAYITNLLAESDVNVATLRLFRKEKGKQAYTIVESDNTFPAGLKDKIMEWPTVTSVDMIDLGGVL